MLHSTVATPPRLASYARQSVGEDQGLRQQVEDCVVEAQRRGWPVVAEYLDNDTSASKARGSATAWAAMLRAFDAGEFDALIVTDVDRLTRSLTDVLEVRPPKRDMRIIVVRGSIDTSDPSGDFMFKQLVLLAEREVAVKTVRAQRYAKERRLAGHPTSGLTPHGYRWIPSTERDHTGTRYSIVEEEAHDVRQIFREYLAGAALAQVARDLNDAGRRTRKGARWHTSTVRRSLLNPLYAALLPPAQPTGEHNLTRIVIEECIPGAWEPIVQRDQLLATRATLIGTKPNHTGNARRWLLSGLAVCSICRSPVRSARGETHPSARKDGSGAAESNRYHAYRCVNGHFMRNGDIIDEYVAEVCIGRISQPDSRTLFAPPETGPDIEVLNARKMELGTRESAIAQLIASGKMNANSARDALDNLADELRGVNNEIARSILRDPLAELAGVADARAWWSEATLARRRAVIDALMVVAIQPVGAGRRVTTMEAAAASIAVEWRH